MKTIMLPIKAMSINKAWQGRRYKTPEYKAWRENIGWVLKKYRDQPIKWCEIEVNFYIKNYGKADLDNFIKTLIDSLVDSKIIEDDRFVTSIRATKFKADNMEFIEISINEKT